MLWTFNDINPKSPIHTTQFTVTHTFLYNPQKLVGDSTKDTVWLKVYDTKCDDSIPIYIYVKIPLISNVPNVMTPGRDNCNSYFILKGMGLGNVKFRYSTDGESELKIILSIS